MKPKATFNSILYRGLVAAILGLVCLFIPGFTILTLIIIIGVAISLAGITSLWFRFKNPHKNSAINLLHWIGAAINIIFGIILIIMPDRFQEVFIILFGVVIIIGGIVQLINSFSVPKLTTNAKVFLGLSILMIVLGTLFIFDIFEKDSSRILFFGIIAMIYGFTNIIMAFWARNFYIKETNKLPYDESQIEDVKHEPVETEENKDNAK